MLAWTCDPGTLTPIIMVRSQYLPISYLQGGKIQGLQPPVVARIFPPDYRQGGVNPKPIAAFMTKPLSGTYPSSIGS